MNNLSILPHCLLALITASSSALAQTAFGESANPQIALPGLSQYAPAAAAGASAAIGRTVTLEALLSGGAEPLKHGLTWRVFHPIPGTDGKLPLLATSEGGSAQFEFEPGDYFIHVAFGRAGVTKKLTVQAQGPMETQRLVLDAGGLVLNAVSGSDVRIPPASCGLTYTKLKKALIMSNNSSWKMSSRTP